MNALVNERLFKLLVVDIGLLLASTQVNDDVMIAEVLILINRGAIAEQFVGQELLALIDPYREPEIFHWQREVRGSSAEVDYIINVGSTIIPVEVKSGSVGRLKSLRLFMEAHNSKFGLRISQKPLEKDHTILSVPFYLVSEIKRLIGNLV